MQTTRLGTRTILFSFPELEANLLAVYGENRTYLCDTFVGPEPMEKVKEVFRGDGRDQPIVVFNSHSHWDHVWGNNAFPGSIVLAHENCRKRLVRDFDRELEENREFARGEVTLCLPDLVFTDRVVFPDDEVEFYFTPGHTDDSASCLDRRDGILFVGDNVESPLPHVASPDLAAYTATLEHYLRLEPAAYVAGHGRRFPRELMEANLGYVRALAEGREIDTTGWSDGQRKLHERNVAVAAQR